MKKKDRVRKNFARILKTKVYSGGGLSVFAVPGRGLIGVAVVKTVKGAVNRNRIKRQLREYARKNVLGKYPSRDVVLVAGDHRFSKRKFEIGTKN
jgi:ribonuclease P protein component